MDFSSPKKPPRNPDHQLNIFLFLEIPKYFLYSTADNVSTINNESTAIYQVISQLNKALEEINKFMEKLYLRIDNLELGSK